MASVTKTWNCAVAEYLLSFLEASPSATLLANVLADRNETETEKALN